MRWQEKEVTGGKIKQEREGEMSKTSCPVAQLPAQRVRLVCQKIGI